jgi:hypothetical protein
MGTHNRLENGRSTWDALSYTIPPVTTSLVEVDRRFRYVYCSHHQGDHPAQVNHSRRPSSSRYFFPSFHGTRSIVAVFVKTLHTCARWIQSTLSHAFYLQDPFYLNLPGFAYPSGFPIKMLYTFNVYHACYMVRSSHSPWQSLWYSSSRIGFNSNLNYVHLSISSLRY